ncbi:hypothetical protein [Acinetobacter guillouiae]|uniref:hypothetical protein n=1 Tax=Acinetobacter guillouiae TaxID=106649 RepID=UPI00125EC235|nr:hypothetical protein [Acinetobacter guillouiae]
MTTGILTEVTLRSGETYIVNLAVLPNIGDTLFLYEPSETEDTESEERSLIEVKVIKIAHVLQHTAILDDYHLIKIVAELVNR